MIRYTDSNEWVKEEGKTATVGITEAAQKELGDIVFIELPKIGDEAKTGKEIAVVESTKAAVDIYSPVTGKVIEVNDELKKNPSLLGESPEDKGWLFKVTV